MLAAIIRTQGGTRRFKTELGPAAVADEPEAGGGLTHRIVRESDQKTSKGSREGGKPLSSHVRHFLLAHIAAGDKDLGGLTPDDYHLSGEKLNEATNRA